MPITVIPEAQPAYDGLGESDASGSVRPQTLASDNAAARKVINAADWTFIRGMCATFAATSCAWAPFALRFETNEPYVWLAGGFIVSLTMVAASANRLLTIVSQGQDRENLFCRSIYSYNRQLDKANSRADEAERQNAILMRIDRRRRRLEGEAGDGVGESFTSPASLRFIPHKGRVQ